MRVQLAIAILLGACGGGSSGVSSRLDITQDYRPPIPTDAQPASIRHIQLQAFAGGSLTTSGIHTPSREVIRDAGAWQAAWNAIFANVSPQPALPAVDFSTQMVLLAAQGDQTSGGFGIFIDGAFTTLDGTVIAAVTTASPGPGCIRTPQVTQPVDAAVVGKAASVAFAERVGVFHCQ